MEVVQSQKINVGRNIVHLMKPNGAEMANFYAQTDKLKLVKWYHATCNNMKMKSTFDILTIDIYGRNIKISNVHWFSAIAYFLFLQTKER